jgi:hypothetical protein
MVLHVSIRMFDRFLQWLEWHQWADARWHGRTLLALLSAETVGLMFVLNYSMSSYLLGAFLAGLSLSTFPALKTEWEVGCLFTECSLNGP